VEGHISSCEEEHEGTVPALPDDLSTLVRHCWSLAKDVWPTDTRGVEIALRARLRRAMENHAKAYGGRPIEKTWLLIAWAQQNGLVPHTLERLDRAGKPIPFWVSLTIRRVIARDNPLSPVSPWCEQWRLLYRAIKQRAGGENIPTTNERMLQGAHNNTNTKTQVGRAAARDNAQEMINWMASASLLQSPHRTDGATLERPPAGEGRPPPPTRTAKRARTAACIRGIPFAIENPRTMLHKQRWFKVYDRYLSFTPLCRWGGAYMKETCLWHPFGRFHIECGRKCHHFPHQGAPHGGKAGQTHHPWTIGGGC
jgi:hypothetical protein